MVLQRYKVAMGTVKIGESLSVKNRDFRPSFAAELRRWEQLKLSCFVLKKPVFEVSKVHTPYTQCAKISGGKMMWKDSL